MNHRHALGDRAVERFEVETAAEALASPVTYRVRAESRAANSRLRGAALTFPERRRASLRDFTSRPEQMLCIGIRHLVDRPDRSLPQRRNSGDRRVRALKRSHLHNELLHGPEPQLLAVFDRAEFDDRGHTNEFVPSPGRKAPPPAGLTAARSARTWRRAPRRRGGARARPRGRRAGRTARRCSRRGTRRCPATSSSARGR